MAQLKDSIVSGNLRVTDATLTDTLKTSMFNSIVTGTGTTAQDKGSGVSPRYFPAKWTFNTGYAPTNGDIIVIKLPCAGHDYGVFVSINNGTSYHPVSTSGTSRLTTHVGSSYYMSLIFKSDGATNSVYPAAGGDARVNVTGGAWYMLNYYDSGNTYDRNRFNSNIVAWGTKILNGNIIVADSTAKYHHLKEGTAFDITYPILYLAGDCNANTATTNTYDCIPFTVTTTQSITLTAYKPVYIKGTLNGTTFTPVSTAPLTQTVPSTDDGYYYILLGSATSSTVIYLLDDHRIFAYKNGKFGEIVNYALTAATATSATSASSATTATSADKLNTDAGSGTQPVYFSNGVPVATTYSLAQSVTSSSKLTDANVKQTNSTASTSHNVLFSTTANTTTEKTEGTLKSANLTYQPSTGTLSATKFSGDISSGTGLTGSQVTTALGYTPVNTSETAASGGTTLSLVTTGEKYTWNNKASSSDITSAINALDVSSVGGSGKYISAISETDGKISATATTMDTIPTYSSTNAVTSDGVFNSIQLLYFDGTVISSIIGTKLADYKFQGIYHTEDGASWLTDLPDFTGYDISDNYDVKLVVTFDSSTVLRQTLYVVGEPKTFWVRIGTKSGNTWTYGSWSAVCEKDREALRPSDVVSTYSSTGTSPVNGTAVKAAIDTLDGNLNNTTPAASKTLTAFSQTDGKVSATFGNISITKSQVSDFPTTMTPSSHTHGNIQNGGTLQTNDVTAASGDKLVITDSSDSNKIARSNIALSATVSSQTTSTKFLREDGTWAAPSYISNDEKVRQTLRAPSSDEYRPLLMSYADTSNSNSNVDNIVYRNNDIYANPKSGYLLAKGFKSTETGAAGIILTDTTGNEFGALYDNGTNLWIGSRTSSSYPHKGGTVISSGWTGTLPTTANETLTGNDTISVSVPMYTATNATTGTWSHALYNVYHSGNHSSPSVTEVTTAGLYKVKYDSHGHITGTTAIAKADITGLGIPSSDTKNTAGSTDTADKIFLVGAKSQDTNPQTYSQDTAYVGTNGHLYSNSKQVVNLSDTQALTNKTYNGYTLGAACAKSVDTTVTSASANLITSGAVYTAFTTWETYDCLNTGNSGVTTYLDTTASTVTVKVNRFLKRVVIAASLKFKVAYGTGHEFAFCTLTSITDAASLVPLVTSRTFMISTGGYTVAMAKPNNTQLATVWMVTGTVPANTTIPMIIEYQYF